MQRILGWKCEMAMKGGRLSEGDVVICPAGGQEHYLEGASCYKRIWENGKPKCEKYWRNVPNMGYCSVFDYDSFCSDMENIGQSVQRLGYLGRMNMRVLSFLLEGRNK